MSKLEMIGLFVGGIVVGGVTAGYAVKNRYEQILEEEIQSVKDAYKDRVSLEERVMNTQKNVESNLIENCEIENIASVDDIKTYNETVKNKTKTDYGKYHKKTIETVEETTIINEEIFIPPSLIDEEEVGMHGYDMKVLTYYSDSILADESDTVLDIETYIGLDNAKLFSENPGCQSMFVRNEQNGIDYEIQRDDMSWSDFAMQNAIKWYDNHE